MAWISVKDELPELDYSKPPYSWGVRVLTSDERGEVKEMKYEAIPYAKRETGRSTRWTRNGRIGAIPTHWQPLPEPPEDRP